MSQLGRDDAHERRALLAVWRDAKQPSLPSLEHVKRVAHPPLEVVRVWDGRLVGMRVARFPPSCSGVRAARIAFHASAWRLRQATDEVFELQWTHAG